MTEKKNTQKEYNYMYEITENIDNDKLNITYLVWKTENDISLLTVSRSAAIIAYRHVLKCF